MTYKERRYVRLHAAYIAAWNTQYVNFVGITDLSMAVEKMWIYAALESRIGLPAGMP